MKKAAQVPAFWDLRCFFVKMSRPVSRVLLKTTIYLVPPLPTGSSHLLGTAGQASVSPYHGVAPDRVYSVHMSPCDGWALTPPFHLDRDRSRLTISVALVRGSPLAGVTRYPCPWSPDFPHAQAFALCPRSFGRLTFAILLSFPMQVNNFSCNKAEKAIYYQS